VAQTCQHIACILSLNWPLAWFLNFSYILHCPIDCRCSKRDHEYSGLAACKYVIITIKRKTDISGISCVEQPDVQQCTSTLTHKHTFVTALNVDRSVTHSTHWDLWFVTADRIEIISLCARDFRVKIILWWYRVRVALRFKNYIFSIQWFCCVLYTKCLK
jgi:hypothetical protein